jgi:hypothetical protein
MLDDPALSQKAGEFLMRQLDLFETARRTTTLLTRALHSRWPSARVRGIGELKRLAAGGARLAEERSPALMRFIASLGETAGSIDVEALRTLDGNDRLEAELLLMGQVELNGDRRALPVIESLGDAAFSEDARAAWQRRASSASH